MQRAAAIELAGAQELLAMLEHPCARPPAPSRLAVQEPQIVASGALFVAATGEMLSPREIEVLHLRNRRRQQPGHCRYVGDQSLYDQEARRQHPQKAGRRYAHAGSAAWARAFQRRIARTETSHVREYAS
jgi:hypothetical protein